MGKWFLSTIGEDAKKIAETYHLGLEIADFCVAENLDRNFAVYDKVCREHMRGISEFWFHAPFAELCPAAIDPLIREITKKRYLQAITQAQSYGIERVVIHGGFIPNIYYKEWFVEQSISFWKEFLENVPQGMELALENVLEPEPDLLVDIAEGVNDSRLGLCLDLGHANLTEVPLEGWIEKTKTYLKHVHLHNNNGKYDWHQPLQEGVMPIHELIKKLEKEAPQATITLELLRCKESVEWLMEGSV